ncbi:MAG: hypothetical protein QM831_08875 [Kofleriaceae bacterium]
MDWLIYGVLAGGGAALAGTRWLRSSKQHAVANAAGLQPISDISHLPPTLQHTALWSIAEGGFERQVVHGIERRGAAEIEVTAFELETLRSRRGAWAYLPVEPPFRLGDVISVCVCELDRRLPHTLLKRTGRGDQMHDDSLGEVATSITRLARVALMAQRSEAADLPATLSTAPMQIELPEQWRAYGHDATALGAPLFTALERTHRRDLVIELIDSLLVVYPAARTIVGADPTADLVSSALALVDAVREIVPAPHRDGV